MPRAQGGLSPCIDGSLRGLLPTLFEYLFASIPLNKFKYGLFLTNKGTERPRSATSRMMVHTGAHLQIPLTPDSLRQWCGPDHRRNSREIRSHRTHQGRCGTPGRRSRERNKPARARRQGCSLLYVSVRLATIETEPDGKNGHITRLVLRPIRSNGIL